MKSSIGVLALPVAINATLRRRIEVCRVKSIRGVDTLDFTQGRLVLIHIGRGFSHEHFYYYVLHNRPRAQSKTD